MDGNQQPNEVGRKEGEKKVLAAAGLPLSLPRWGIETKGEEWF